MKSLDRNHESRLHRLSCLLIAFVLVLPACATRSQRTQSQVDLSACQIVYDAGSSRTRLYVYEQTTAGWVQHRGPRINALADPVRHIRGKTMSDAGAVVDAFVTALDDIRHDGPVDKTGKPRWPAFDWQKRCRIDTAAVFATGGMRLAEQMNPGASELLWGMLNEKLEAVLGMPVTTRTISGYEEGLFAWLAIREGQDDGNFGVADMGGASVQLTFSCDGCEASAPVKVKGDIVSIYSHSYLGWGQDEAWKQFAPMPACAAGVALKSPDWQIADCASSIRIDSNPAAEIKGSPRDLEDLRWYLIGAFRYMQDSDIQQFCREGIISAFEPETSCFRAVYLQHVLNMLGVPAGSVRSNLDWTLGAVICNATQCFDVQ